tara:strand:+ start:743 stop:994 length:252 start_codon:yes stop_codon:yes gene_type:complete
MSFLSRVKKAGQNISPLLDLYEAHTISNTQEEKENLYKKATAKMKANGITCDKEAVQTMKDAKNLVAVVGGTIFWGTVAAIVS